VSTPRPARRHDDGRVRCAWCTADPLYVEYHDTEWGIPVRDDRTLFEMLCLEGAQAGLSWLTVLRKREHYRQVFDGFDAHRMARYPPSRITRLLADPGIIRHRQKVEAFVTNARAYLELQDTDGSLAEVVWRYQVKAAEARPGKLRQVPTVSAESDALSRDLKRRGFKFVGSTICYAYMQAVGIVDDHQAECFRAAR
jgi:DNA-3-methyladenine glycosylase I